VTKARACKVTGQEGSPGVTLHAPGSVGKCEGMNPHTSELPLWEFSLGGLPNFQRVIAGVKIQWIEEFLISWKVLGTSMSKMGLHDPFGHLKHKLWSKEKLGVKLVI